MPEGEEDNALRGLAQGDPAALGKLFEQHQQRLLHIIRVRLDPRMASRIDPEDVLQEVYLDAAMRIHHYVENSEHSFFVWLRLVTNQTMANLYRRHLGTKKRDARRDVSISSAKPNDSPTRSIALQLIGHLTSPSKVAIRKESIEKLETAIEALRPIDREAIMLRHFELLDNKEAAEVLGINEKAASIRYIRAIARLQESIALAEADSEATESDETTRG